MTIAEIDTTTSTFKVIRELIEAEQSYLSDFFKNLNIDAVDKILNLLLNCQGMIFLTGVGKSELIAKKIAVTMTSTGTRASFISPTNALHGDLGIVKKGDLFLVLSKSGESDEACNLIPFVRNKNVETVAIVNNESSRLAKACDFVLALPNVKELCPFDMAPTTSTTVQAIIGDILAISLMRLKNFSIEEYATFHPAGRIGRRISMKVEDIMISGNNVPKCKADDSLVDTLVELSNKQCGAVLIVDNNECLLGIFTDGDLRRALQNLGVNALQEPMKNVMIKYPKYINSEILAWDAMKVMEADQKHPIMVLPVLDSDKKVVGLIKMHDLIQAGI